MSNFLYDGSGVARFAMIWRDLTDGIVVWEAARLGLQRG